MKNDLLLEYDESVDAAYIVVSEADWDHQFASMIRAASTTQQTGP